MYRGPPKEMHDYSMKLFEQRGHAATGNYVADDVPVFFDMEIMIRALICTARCLKNFEDRHYYVGIDPENHAMTNVSVWDTHADAEQMATLQPMLDLAKIFVEAGVRFERPITNHETLWTM